MSFQKFIWQNSWSTKNCPGQGKAGVFPQLCTEAEEYPRDLLGPVYNGAGVRSTVAVPVWPQTKVVGSLKMLLFKDHVR